MKAFLPLVLALITVACDPMDHPSPTCNGVRNHGTPALGWQAIVDAIEAQCGPVNGDIYWGQRGTIDCGDPANDSGCAWYPLAGCNVGIGVTYGPNGNEVPEQTGAARTSEVHELCHEVCNEDDPEGSGCVTRIRAAACRLDPIDCVE